MIVLSIIIALQSVTTFSAEFVAELPESADALDDLRESGFRIVDTFKAFDKQYAVIESSMEIGKFSTQVHALTTLGLKKFESNFIYTLQGGSPPPKEDPDDLPDFNPRPVFPNDSHFNKLWGLVNFGQTIQSSKGIRKADSSAAQAWNITTGSDDTIVGIMDTGVDYTHEDLNQNLWSFTDENGEKSYGRDVFSQDNDVMDSHSHGTHVAGTIGARADNGIGVAGINWNVKMASVQIFNGSGQTNLATILRGLDWFYKRRATIKIINHSWGGNQYSEILDNAFKKLDSAGVINVIAAGNNSSYLDHRSSKAKNHIYPAMYVLENSLVVASFDNKAKLSGFSNYSNKIVDLGAPGSSIYSTIPGSGYGYKSGTSMAAPHVTGAVALLLSAYPEWTASQIKAHILERASSWSSLDEVSRDGKALNIHNLF